MNAASAAVYEDFFVPALFRQWVELVMEAANIRPGHRVLDVGCGTGVLTRAVAARVGPEGKAVGLDPSEGMLAVASRISPEIELKRGFAESLPFESESFDRVVSQFGLMFFADRVEALREMMRVLCRGGLLAVAVWDDLDRAPGYAALVALLQRLFGDSAADALRAPFSLGDTEELAALFFDAGIDSAAISTHEGVARFPSIKSWIFTDVKGWSPVGQCLDDDQFDALVSEAERTLEAFASATGAVEFPVRAHIANAAKR